MVFAVSAAKERVLRKLAERDWSPTDLAEELDRTPETIYNHLHDLEDQGVLSTRQIEAKTRPKTEYSIGNGLIQYVAVLPGHFQQGSIRLDVHKEAVFRIWMVPQDEFHPYLEQYWWRLRTCEDLAFEDDIVAVAVYGSVARGEADEDSDVDLLVVAADEAAGEVVRDRFGSALVKGGTGSKICMTETYTEKEYRDSLAHGSDFLDTIRDERHVLYDPDRFLLQSEPVVPR
jgi:DNA-binding PadR family transcriptional regulator